MAGGWIVTCRSPLNLGDFLDRDKALAWVTEHQSTIPMFDWWQMFTDCAPRGGGTGSRKTRMHRLRGDYLARYAEYVVKLAASGAALPVDRRKPSLLERQDGSASVAET